jgi:hypothetical protein
MISEGKARYSRSDRMLLELWACNLESRWDSLLRSVFILLGQLQRLTFCWGFYHLRISLSCKQGHNAFHHLNQTALLACFG